MCLVSVPINEEHYKWPSRNWYIVTQKCVGNSLNHFDIPSNSSGFKLYYIWFWLFLKTEDAIYWNLNTYPSTSQLYWNWPSLTQDFGLYSVILNSEIEQFWFCMECPISEETIIWRILNSYFIVWTLNWRFWLRITFMAYS